MPTCTRGVDLGSAQQLQERLLFPGGEACPGGLRAWPAGLFFRILWPWEPRRNVSVHNVLITPGRSAREPWMKLAPSTTPTPPSKPSTCTEVEKRRVLHTSHTG